MQPTYSYPPPGPPAGEPYRGSPPGATMSLPPLHLALIKGPWTRRNVLRVFLVYAFVFDVGAVGFVLASSRMCSLRMRPPS